MDEEVALDLRDRGISVARPTYQVTAWNPRKSVVCASAHPLMPGYLLVGQAFLPSRSTRRWCRFLLSASGLPAEVWDAEDVIRRAEVGEFDVALPGDGFGDGARVFVRLLGLAGEVVRRVRRLEYEVLLGNGRTVMASQGGLSLA